MKRRKFRGRERSATVAAETRRKGSDRERGRRRGIEKRLRRRRGWFPLGKAHSHLSVKRGRESAMEEGLEARDIGQCALCNCLSK